MTTNRDEATETLSTEILTVERELNETLADTGKVKFAFRAHFTDTANGVNGIEQLIRAIMISRGCVHPKGSELTPLRSIVIQQSLFADEVIAIVRGEFGPDRYPDSTIKAYLSCKNARATILFGKVSLTKEEDYARDCKKPRTKYFVIATNN